MNEAARNGTRGDRIYVIVKSARENVTSPAWIVSNVFRNAICDITVGVIQEVMVMRRAIGDAMMTAGSALTLVLALVLLDDRVRDQLSAVVDPRHPGAALADMGQRVNQIAAIVAVAARNQSIDHAPLVIFALAATVLVLFMLRT